MAELKAVKAKGAGAAAASGVDRSIGESLSALLDDEAQDLETRRVLRHMETDDSLRQRWYRYQLVRGSLHGEPVTDAPDFAARIQAAIAEEPVPEAKRGGLKRTLGSFAVAASVTMAVVLGGQQLALVGAEGDVSADRVASLPVGVVNTRGAVPVRASFGTRAVPTLQPAERTAYRELARQRLRRYGQEHAEHAYRNTPQGMLAFARVPVIEE